MICMKSVIFVSSSLWMRKHVVIGGVSGSLILQTEKDTLIIGKSCHWEFASSIYIFFISIWPEYEKHLKRYIYPRSGIHILSGKTNIGKLWKDSVSLIINRMEDKVGWRIDKKAEEEN